VERYQSGGLCFPAKVFLSDSLLLLFLFFACSAVQSFGFRQRLLSERELSLMVLGLSFYPLEQAPLHRDLCNEQIRDSNERNVISGGTPALARRSGFSAQLCGK